MENDAEKKVAELNAILARDEGDFFIYRKRDGSLGAKMRYRWCPVPVWALYEIIYRVFIGTLRKRPPVVDAETALLRDEY